MLRFRPRRSERAYRAPGSTNHTRAPTRLTRQSDERKKARGFAPGPHQGALPLGGFQGSALTFLRSLGCARPRAGADRRQTGGHMNATTFKSWLGQVTTGIGALIAAPVVIALPSAQ